MTLSPTFNIYSASRDVMRARSFDWHERYTLPSLMDFYAPSATNHGSYYKDWTSEDEVAWRGFYAKWFDLVKDFHDRGGRVTAGSDPGASPQAPTLGISTRPGASPISASSRCCAKRVFPRSP